MSENTLRAPTDHDWPAILTLAELSLSELPNAPSQDEWLKNRKSFSPSHDRKPTARETSRMFDRSRCQPRLGCGIRA